MCNLVLIVFQTAGVDMQHAVIEYNDQENVYVLKDLNTAQGTYVNECRVQNAAIRMAPGDQIKFGYMGMPYEFVVDNQPSVSYEIWMHNNLCVCTEHNIIQKEYYIFK